MSDLNLNIINLDSIIGGGGGGGKSALKFVMSDSASNTPEGVQWNDSGTIITGTLVASNMTEGKIYLVRLNDTDMFGTCYDAYMTFLDNGIYFWMKVSLDARDASMDLDVIFVRDKEWPFLSLYYTTVDDRPMGISKINADPEQMNNTVLFNMFSNSNVNSVDYTYNGPRIISNVFDGRMGKCVLKVDGEAEIDMGMDSSLRTYTINFCQNDDIVENVDNRLVSIYLPYNVSKVGERCFEDSSKLNEVVFSNGTDEIGKYSFHGCSNLKHLKLPETLKILGEYAFADCSALTEFTIPIGITYLPEGLLSGCVSIKYIVCNNSVPPVIGNNALQGVPDDCVIMVPEKYIDDYKESEGWSERKDHIEKYDGYLDYILSGGDEYITTEGLVYRVKIS